MSATPVTSGTTVPDVLPASVLDGLPDSESWDVVVVGFGIAGGCAALEAARAGARVLLLERASVHGGTSSMSGGHFYLGGGTAVQRATGHEDSADEMYAYLMATTKEPEPDKIRAYCDGSVEHLDWLESLGFEFERSYYAEKAVIQPGTQGLMYTGNEKVWPYREQAVPAPRGHKVPVAGDTEGTRLVMDLLRARVEEAGVEVRYETGATQLIASDAWAVVGVGWRRFSETGVVRAGAVVLAAGGFVMNADMVAAHTPTLGSKLFTLGSTYDDGLGIRLGQSVGAELRHMDEPFITAPFYPPSVLVTGVIVNRLGERFVAEDSYHARTSAHVLAQPGHAAYLIVDSEHVEHPKMPLVPFLDGYETLAEMEEGLGVPAGSLERTLGRYNEHAARGEDPDFHKHPDWLAPQAVAPWGVYDLTLGHALYAGFTLGGMRTTVDAQVQRPDGSVIPGLYAAGACASNIAQDGAGYCSGTQLGEGSFFGRRAGRHAAGG
ncbi:succinate dehydrogenase/fumarate reductase flavoprotein subunit [Nocardioides ginsengisegetis]|uniref:Succinate dehydrogenase/fumarate reductase flavoprotein subunit n=1 Tax=Nocardioides ginsengisegetis TaxID=661491 RepID=A0A7W3J2Z6_9ACTN|nr:FAD-binding protein [Nocardioides ginsengisegetis]MBA8805343.1 succinate dehydrogenase/fumarate reductase flavoprotein subunit [Nocardioides ginsengisegetis]